MTKRTLKLLVIVVGVFGALIAFLSTPDIVITPQGRTGMPCPPDYGGACGPDTANAILRAAGVSILATLVFLGLTATFTDKGEDDRVI